MDGETLDIPLGAANSNQVNKGYNVIVKWIDNPQTVPNRATFTSIGAHAENYVLTDNAHVGERPIVAHDRVITSLGNSGLEGACILTAPIEP